MCRDRNTRPWRRLTLWVVLLALGLAWRGPTLVRSLRPGDNHFLDFSQEWASARNFFHGMPVYANLRQSLAWHTGRRPRIFANLKWNGHPPASVLLGLPLAGLN